VGGGVEDEAGIPGLVLELPKSRGADGNPVLLIRD
jgi:hypothetical protein